ncbi:hypothetical protein EFA46_009785 [Halarchaeum sp. CBA1220]|uniref:hypothetical protein n=1 Tax=Halarchaeum sp. CBA1220 TaxID=1853682 RepID=UPI000F3A8E19|nr:hypothetical protein [Halarchaeum sp. CBA1220]QLC34483.1 hypothetical protein EFA46_009785 [Halarchaeum sp. CBA1220]
MTDAATPSAVLVDLLLNLQLVLSAVAFVLSLIAYRGYAGTPWGRVLEPIPVLLASILVTTGIEGAVPEATYLLVSAVCWTVTTGAVVLSTYRITTLRRGASR